MAENEYLPYKAINVFIERDYLEQIIEATLKGIESLSKEDQIAFTNSFKQYVSILGFRNAVRAPFSLKVNAYATAFEGKDEVVPFTLSTWTKLNADLAKSVKNWLETEGWKELTLERHFSESEGFINEWPDKLSFDKLEKKFKKANPDIEFSRDDLILLVLWISGQLPNEQSDI